MGWKEYADAKPVSRLSNNHGKYSFSSRERLHSLLPAQVGVPFKAVFSALANRTSQVLSARVYFSLVIFICMLS
jgi:hypothetical protein